MKLLVKRDLCNVNNPTDDSALEAYVLRLSAWLTACANGDELSVSETDVVT